MLTLSSIQRAKLRAAAHSLKPIVIIGEKGLTSAVLYEIDRSLAAHMLIKIRILSNDREARKTINQEICDQLHAASIQQLGKLLLVYRPGHSILKAPENN